MKLRTLALRFVEVKDGEEVWKFPGGMYSAACKEIRPKKDKVDWQRLLWRPLNIPKHSIIAWMAIINRLPTKDRLRSWGTEMEGNCVLCQQEMDTRDHIFFGCSFSQGIWMGVLQLC